MWTIHQVGFVRVNLKILSRCFAAESCIVTWSLTDVNFSTLLVYIRCLKEEPCIVLGRHSMVGRAYFRRASV